MAIITYNHMFHTTGTTVIKYSFKTQGNCKDLRMTVTRLLY